MYEAKQNKEKVCRVICKSRWNKGMMQMSGKGTHMKTRSRKNQRPLSPESSSNLDEILHSSQIMLQNKNTNAKGSGLTTTPNGIPQFTDNPREILMTGNRQSDAIGCAKGYDLHHLEVTRIIPRSDGSLIIYCNVEDVNHDTHSLIHHVGGVEQAKEIERQYYGEVQDMKYKK